MATKHDGKTPEVRRFTTQKAVKIRTAEGRSASTSAQAVAAGALKSRYGGNGPKPAAQAAGR